VKHIGKISIAFGALIAASSLAAAANPSTIVTIVKLSGIAWFDRMEVGVKKYATDTGAAATQVGPAKSDAQVQVQLIEDTIAKKPNAIAVVPFSVESVEPVLKKAMSLGIKVVTHEASSIQNAEYDVEAFKNADYGAHLMDHLAKCMHEDGEYAVFVGSLTSKTHNEWVDAAIARQKEKYPKMTLVGSKNESSDDQQKSHDKALELLRAYPKLKGFEGSSSLDVPGIGRAVEERGLAGKVCVIGTGLPSQTTQYLDSGAINLISFWDPALAGYAMNRVAQMVIDGKSVASGADLGVPGYEKVVVDGKVIYGSAWVDVTKDNASQYPF
jgi:simple sugar transport system substrate-binding protein